MNQRIERLREESFAAMPSISVERALLETRFYKDNHDKHSLPVLRALVFKDLCEKKTLWLGEGELIVGERGPRDGATMHVDARTALDATLTWRARPGTELQLGGTNLLRGPTVEMQPDFLLAAATRIERRVFLRWRQSF